MQKKVNILGIRGIPAAHGGFETFAHHFSLYLVKNGWDVTVYCQHDRNSHLSPKDGSTDTWNGVRRIHFSTNGTGALSTMQFDLRCSLDSRNKGGIDLVLGYNTAIFNFIQRAFGKTVYINMDGIEWRRDKWGYLAKAWFYLNELCGCYIANKCIADHPEIKIHLKRHGLKNCAVIPYGSHVVKNADERLLQKYNLIKNNYFISIARIEPENSILEMVEAYASRKRNSKLVVLGKFDPSNSYHCSVKRFESDCIIFPGAIYDQATVQSLRFNSRAYLHGHQVGGTNPSLVEALGCGNAVIAHSNRFNKWVAGTGQQYFNSVSELSDIIEALDFDEAPLLRMRESAIKQHQDNFTFDLIHQAYEDMLLEVHEDVLLEVN